MNEPRAVLAHTDHDTAHSPQRKKVRRQKYAPKACVSCRRSKLKCSGETPPCQRCLDTGKRCFYSEDQTAAEALQTLSRPPPASPLPVANPDLSYNVHGPVLSIEARMARMEALMQAVLNDRAATLPADETTTNGAFTELPSATVRFGSRILAFPSPVDYQRYCALFFADLHRLYPCVDEPSFRAASDRMLAYPAVTPVDTCLLALHYILFACVDILHAPTPSAPLGKPAGWQWFHLADELVGKRPQYGCGDVDLAQFLLFQALYFVFAEQPSLAYSTIGMASRLALQHGLHRRSSYASLTASDTHQRTNIFWNIYIADRRISLSCRRPYSIRESDIDIRVDVEWSAALHGQVSPATPCRSRQEPHPDPLPRTLDTDGAFMTCMVDWSHLAGAAWDCFSAATASHSTPDGGDMALMDARITQYTQDTISKLTERIWPDPRVYHVYMSLNNLRLFVARPAILSLDCTPETARICCSVASDTVSRASYLPLAGPMPSYRWDAASSYANTLVAICALVVRALDQPEETAHEASPNVAAAPTTDEQHVIQLFHRVVEALYGMTSELALAQRFLDDFGPVVSALKQAIEARRGSHGATPATPHHLLDLIPYRDVEPVLCAGPRWSEGGVDWRDGGRVLWM